MARLSNKWNIINGQKRQREAILNEARQQRPATESNPCPTCGGDKKVTQAECHTCENERRVLHSIERDIAQFGETPEAVERVRALRAKLGEPPAPLFPRGSD